MFFIFPHAGAVLKEGETAVTTNILEKLTTDERQLVERVRVSPDGMELSARLLIYLSDNGASVNKMTAAERNLIRFYIKDSGLIIRKDT